jgi:hypothetical protein
MTGSRRLLHECCQTYFIIFRATRRLAYFPSQSSDRSLRRRRKKVDASKAVPRRSSGMERTGGAVGHVARIRGILDCAARRQMAICLSDTGNNRSVYGVFRGSSSWRWRFSRPSIRYRLVFPVFLLQLPLHLKVGLSLTLDPLLLVVSNDAHMHCLNIC